jgi:hypothetical protein
VTDVDQGTPAAAKLHGAYAWEASPDGWATHPIAGGLSGYFWLTCRPASGVADPTCKQALAMEIAKAGTSTTIGFSGSYFVEGGAIQPPGLYAESQAGHAVLYGTDAQIGGMPMNPNVCPAALALPRNSPDGGTEDAGGSTDANTSADAQGAGGEAGSGGASGAGGSGGSSTSGGGTDMTGSAGSAAPPATSHDDGGCAIAHRRSGGARVAGLALFAAALLIDRSRKRRARG